MSAPPPFFSSHDDVSGYMRSILPALVKRLGLPPIPPRRLRNNWEDSWDEIVAGWENTFLSLMGVIPLSSLDFTTYVVEGLLGFAESFQTLCRSGTKSEIRKTVRCFSALLCPAGKQTISGCSSHYSRQHKAFDILASLLGLISIRLLPEDLASETSSSSAECARQITEIAMSGMLLLAAVLHCPWMKGVAERSTPFSVAKGVGVASFCMLMKTNGHIIQNTTK